MLWCVLYPEGVFYHVVMCFVSFRLHITATLGFQIDGGGDVIIRWQ